MRNAAFVLAAILCGAACGRQPPANEVAIAAAANLTSVFQQLAPRFERDTGIHPVMSFGSTAQLSRQVENAAPFDVIAAADASHVDELERKGLLAAGSSAVYATGVLALWIPPSRQVSIERVEQVQSPDIHVIAIAKPELAPYGQATVETLRQLGIWDAVQPKIVYAENISMARQYGASNNADAVFTAYSLVLNEAGKVIRVDETLHKPIHQKLGIVARAQHPKQARLFVDYLLHGKGRELLESYGYQVGATAVQER